MPHSRALSVIVCPGSQKISQIFSLDGWAYHDVAWLSRLKNCKPLIRLHRTVSNGLNAPQLKIFTKIPLKNSYKPVEYIQNLCFSVVVKLTCTILIHINIIVHCSHHKFGKFNLSSKKKQINFWNCLAFHNPLNPKND